MAYNQKVTRQRLGSVGIKDEALVKIFLDLADGKLVPVDQTGQLKENKLTELGLVQVHKKEKSRFVLTLKGEELVCGRVKRPQTTQKKRPQKGDQMNL